MLRHRAKLAKIKQNNQAQIATIGHRTGKVEMAKASSCKLQKMRRHRAELAKLTQSLNEFSVLQEYPCVLLLLLLHARHPTEDLATSPTLPAQPGTQHL